MNYRHYSVPFIALFSLIFGFIVFSLYFSFKNHIRLEDVEATGLPILHIDTENSKVINSTQKYIGATCTLEGKTTSAKIRGRGNSTWTMKKKPYLLKFNIPQEFLGLPKASKWVLMANGGDNTNLRNAYATYLAINVWNNFKWTPNYRYVNLYLNGRYEGIYQVYEKIEASSVRLNIPDPKINFFNSGSLIMVMDTRDKKPIHFHTNSGIRFAMYSPREVSDDVVLFLQSAFNKFEDLLFSDDFADKENGYQKYIDIDSFVDWYIINEFTLNRDARFKDSCFVYYNPDEKKLNMGPIWDFDISSGNNSYEGNSKPEGYWIRTQASWYKRLFEDPYFSKKVIDRWLSTQESLSKSFEDIYKLSRQIKPASELNDKAWRSIGHYAWPHATDWHKRKTYDDEVDYFMDWLKKRQIWVNNDIQNILSKSTKQN